MTPEEREAWLDAFARRATAEIMGRNVTESRARSVERIAAAMEAEAAPKQILISASPSNDGCGVNITVRVDGGARRFYYFANHELDHVNEDGYLVRPIRYGLSELTSYTLGMGD